MTKHKIKVDNFGVHNVEVDLPSNSHKSKETPKKPKVQDKIIKGGVQRQKKSVGKKASQVFFGDNLPNVMSYLVQDVLIPAAKTTLYELISGGSEIWLWGEKRSYKTHRSGGNSRINYNSLSYGPSYINQGPRNAPPQQARNLRYNDILDDLKFERRGDAELALETLAMLIDEYGAASVADLYSRIGITEEFTDHNRGWTNVAEAEVQRVRGGWLLVLPPVVRLN